MPFITHPRAIEEFLRVLLVRKGSHLSATKLKENCLYLTKSTMRTKLLEEKAQALGIPVHYTDKSALEKLVQNKHRGMALRVQELNCVPGLKGFLKAQANKMPSKDMIILALDKIQDPYNLGAILRTAEQFSVDLVLITKHHSASDTSPIVANTSAGALYRLPILWVNSLTASLQELKHQNFWVYGADLRAKPLQKVALAPRAVLVMGSEGQGLSPLVRKHCDERITIETQGKLDSLNVSVAAGIALYTLLSRRAPSSLNSTAQ